MSMAQILLCGGAIVTLSMGIRHGFGLWLQPITQEMGWTRENFSLAIAVQNLSWGILGIFVGMLADRIGAFKVLIGGSVLYALGLVGMALSPSSTVFLLTAGVLIGAAQAGTTYAVIYGVLGRQIPGAAQLGHGRGRGGGIVRPVLHGARGGQADRAVRLVQCLADTGAVRAADCRPGLWPARAGLWRQHAHQARADRGPGAQEAWTYPSFLLLMAGYFVCGFQVMFIGVHMPSYLKDFGMAPHVASYSLALVGLFNIFGTYLAGNLGQKLPKRYLLSGIYGLRSVATVAFCWPRCRPGRSMPSAPPWAFCGCPPCR
jgi:MFS family permease